MARGFMSIRQMTNVKWKMTNDPVAAAHGSVTVTSLFIISSLRVRPESNLLVVLEELNDLRGRPRRINMGAGMNEGLDRRMGCGRIEGAELAARLAVAGGVINLLIVFDRL